MRPPSEAVGKPNPFAIFRSLIIVIGMLAEKVEVLAECRPESEDREHLVAGDLNAIRIARDFIDLYNEAERDERL